MKKQRLITVSIVIAVVAVIAGYAAFRVYQDRYNPRNERDARDFDYELMKKARAEHEAKFAKAEKLEVIVGDGHFNQASFVMEKGKPYKLTLSATDAAEHVIRVPAFSIATVVTAKSGPVVYDVAPDTVGESEIYCSNHKAEKVTLSVK